jgi:hypothetical protein
MLNGQFQVVGTGDQISFHSGQNFMLHLLQLDRQVLASFDVVQHQEATLFTGNVLHIVAHPNQGIAWDGVRTLSANLELPERLHNARLNVELFFNTLKVTSLRDDCTV